MILSTIYSRDATCYSIGDYQDREYYHIITNSNGDSTITEDDQNENFDTENFDDGEYILEVITHDASGNESSASMNITFNNFDIDSPPDQTNNISLSNSPNPFKDETIIKYKFARSNFDRAVKITVYDSRGELIKTIETDRNQVTFESDGLAPGVYFYKLAAGEFSRTEKMVLLK